MRQMIINSLDLQVQTNCSIDDHGNQSSTKIVRDKILFYKRVNTLLLNYPQIIESVHEDLSAYAKDKFGKAALTGRSGRKPIYTTENLFRAVIVKKMEAATLRNASFLIAQSMIFHDFCKLGLVETVDYSLICRTEKAIQHHTWEKINQLLTTIGINAGLVDPEEARMDATVMAVEVHYPADVHQLWDCYRSMALRIRRILKCFDSLPRVRFHERKVKKYYLDTIRFSKSTSKQRKRDCHLWTKKLINSVSDAIQRTKTLVETAIQIMSDSGKTTRWSIESDTDWLTLKYPVMEQIVDIAQQRNDGEKVPNEKKVFSLFENHVNLIIRGRAGIPFELGHKIFLSQSRSKFILDYCVCQQNKSDTELLEQMTTRHEERFGKGSLKTVHADKGCRSKESEMKKIYQRVETVYVPSRLKDLHEPDLVDSQKFRAGIEGAISCLKRRFQLAKTRKRGYKSFCSEIGEAIFCHNLRILCQSTAFEEFLVAESPPS